MIVDTSAAVGTVRRSDAPAGSLRGQDASPGLDPASPMRSPAWGWSMGTSIGALPGGARPSLMGNSPKGGGRGKMQRNREPRTVQTKATLFYFWYMRNIFG